MNKNKTKQCCATCEFNFGTVCAGYGTRTDNNEPTYGMPMEEAEKMFPNGCEDYSISAYAYMQQQKNIAEALEQEFSFPSKSKSAILSALNNED